MGNPGDIRHWMHQNSGFDLLYPCLTNIIVFDILTATLRTYKCAVLPWAMVEFHSIMIGSDIVTSLKAQITGARGKWTSKSITMDWAGF